MANINDMFLSLIEGLSFQNGVYVDNQKDNETLYEVNRMGSSEALDPQNIKKIVKKTDDAKLFMVDMFDLHIGGQAHKSARARMVFDFVAKTRNAYTVLGGDIFDNANLEGQTNPTLSKVIPYYQEDYLESLPEVRECLRENKIIAAVYGNHDGYTNNRTKAANISMVKSFCKRNNLPYAEYNLLLQLVMPGPGGNDITTNIGITHGSSKTSLVGNACESEKTKFFNAMRAANLDPSMLDIIKFGHLHIDGQINFQIDVPVRDKNGKSLPDKTKSLAVISEPPMQGLTDYAIRNNMAYSGTNAYITELQWVQNPRYKYDKDREFPYSLHVSRYNVLDANRDAYSEQAKEILENPLYKEPIELRSEIVDKYLNNNKEILKDFPKVFE